MGDTRKGGKKGRQKGGREGRRKGGEDKWWGRRDEAGAKGEAGVTITFHQDHIRDVCLANCLQSNNSVKVYAVHKNIEHSSL